MRSFRPIMSVVIVTLCVCLPMLAQDKPAGPASGPASSPAASAGEAASLPAVPRIVSELVNQRIKFDPFCFVGPQFPNCEFEVPQTARELLGPYTLKVAFYDATGQPVTSAEKLGRYAAVVTIVRPGMRESRRFVTLCRIAAELPSLPAASQPASLTQAGVDASLLAPRAGEFATWLGKPKFSQATPDANLAAMTAGLFDLAQLKADGKELPTDNLIRLDRQWWVNFKRGLYGYDKAATPFLGPRPIEGEPARVMHEGTLAEAGMKSDTVAAIDAAAELWVKEVNLGFSLTVVRHGVVIVNKGYGSVKTPTNGKDGPFTAETVGPLASTTKFFTAVMVAQFADQGLIGLDEPVAKYIPAMQGVQVVRPLTVRAAFLHTGGFAGQQWGDLVNDLEEVVADFYPSMQVGLRHQYDGTGMALVAKAMEMMTGESMPRLFHRCLFGPLECKSIDTDYTSFGSVANSYDLAKVGQMMANGGAYGKWRFTSPQIIQQMMPISGQDRFPPDMTVRWGIGIKQFDVDGLSEQAYGHPGAGGSCVVIDPQRDLVIAMVRMDEGPDYRAFLRKRGRLYKAILDSIEK